MHINMNIYIYTHHFIFHLGLPLVKHPTRFRRCFKLLLFSGNKTWNNTFVAHVAACTMKGAREYRRNRS